MSILATLEPSAPAPKRTLNGLPVGWRWESLENIASVPVLYGILQPGPDTPDGIPYVRPTEITRDVIDLPSIRRTTPAIAAKYKRSLLCADDVILSIVGTIGKVAVVPSELEGGNITQSSVRVRVRPELSSSRFIAWALRAPVLTQQYDRHRLGTAVPRLNVAHARALQIPLPPLDEQRRIVAEIEKQFTRLEAGVASLKRVQTALKRYRASVLKAACEGRLVPTEAELAHRESRAYEPAAALLVRILEERRAKWTGRGKYQEPLIPRPSDHEPDALPEGWSWSTVGQVIAEPLCNGISVKGSDNPPGVRALRLSAMSDCGFDYSKARFLPLSDADVDDLWIQPGDFFMSRGNGSLHLVGRGTTAQPPTAPTIFPDTMIRLRWATTLRGARWLQTLWPSRIIRTQIERKVKTTAGIYKIAQPQAEQIVVPLPPLAEQHRIVAEVERRLSVIEELEAVVATNVQRAARLRQSILQRAFDGGLVRQQPFVSVLPKTEEVPAKTRSRPNRHFARALLSAEIVHRLHAEPTFGRIKHQKVFHLCEHIARLPEIEGQYHREAAGPLDNRLIYANEAELKKQHWFEEIPREGYGHAYRALPKAGSHRKYLEGSWPDQLATIERLIELMRTWDTDRCEIFSTTYAAWNDLVLWGKEPTAIAILQEILERWHERKKRIPEDRWRRAIAWMQKEGFAPTGFGKPTCAPGQ